jgi:small subunit ribosomal protein S1
MKVVLANKAGFCFGVERAVNEASQAAVKYNKKIYTLGPIIHNRDVVEKLKEKNIFPINIEDIDKLNSDDVVIIRSHGVGKEIYDILKKKELEIIDATCPFVTNIHLKVNKYFNQGYGIIIVGDKDHPEVIGINGWCNNMAIITKDGQDLTEIPSRICMVAQTTEKKDNWDKVLERISGEGREILSFNTICTATSERQSAAADLSKTVDAMVVLGGRDSSNSKKLFKICSENCKNTIFVENSGEIPDYIIKDKKINKIGVTAGASTPEWIIKEAITKMSDEKNLELNEQLEFMEKFDRRIAVGSVVSGKIISINEKGVYLNIGYKADGLLPLEEVTLEPNEKLGDLFKEGDFIQVKVISRKNEDGYVVLSKIELEREEAYNKIKDAFEKKEPIKVTVKEAVNGGVITSFRGVRIFVPASHIELFHVENLDEYVGKTIDVQIIEFKEVKRNTKIVASRRSLLQKDREKAEEGTWEKLEEGQTVKGEVKRMTPFGAFVDVDGVDGLLHVSELSYGRIDKPSDILKIGQEIETYILNVDKENKKLSLSLKKLIEDPWKNVSLKYPVDSVVLGKVVRFADFGAFIELEPGVDALAHISQISHKRINKPGDVLELGQMVKAKIIDVNTETKKIGLSIKEVNDL